MQIANKTLNPGLSYFFLYLVSIFLVYNETQLCEA